MSEAQSLIIRQTKKVSDKRKDIRKDGQINLRIQNVAEKFFFLYSMNIEYLGGFRIKVVAPKIEFWPTEKYLLLAIIWWLTPKKYVKIQTDEKDNKEKF